MSVSNRRADIQGLRAIAVVGVFLFHLDPTVLSGGFLGVDVFFVISGFVIGRLLLAELIQTGQVRLAGFMAKRIFRLLPALATVTTIVVAAAHLFLTSQAVHHTVNQTALGALTGTSNWIIAWISGGYFGDAPERNPLLHTWSLSAEWQFYLLIPLVFWAIQRLNLPTQMKVNFLLSLLLTIGVLSFFFIFLDLPNLLDGRADVSGYYSPLGRFWEFLAGVLVAAYEKRLTPNRKVAEILGFLGFVMILVAFLLFFGGMQTPGRSTLIPVLGTALLIIAGSNPKSSTSTALSARPLSWIGDHSYSIYLWHWPIIFFAQKFGFLDTILGLIVIIFSTLLLSALSYRFIEVKMRYPVRPIATGNILVALSMLVAPALIITVWNYTSNSYHHELIRLGITDSIRGDVGHDVFHQTIAAGFSECSDRTIRDQALSWNSFLRCQQTSGEADITVALIGDSHAEHLFYGLAEASPGVGIVYYIRGELPIPGESQEMAQIIEKVSGSPSIETVIISAYWAARGVPESELREVIRRFERSGKQVILTNDIPSSSTDQNPEDCKRSPQIFGMRECEFGVYRFEEVANNFNALDQVISGTGAHRFDSYSLICSLESPVCSFSAFDDAGTETLIYRDKDHLNLEGSKLIGIELAKLVSGSP